VLLLKQLALSLHFDVYFLRKPQRKVKRRYMYRTKLDISRLPLDRNLGLGR